MTQPGSEEEHNSTTHMLFKDIHKVYDLVNREDLYIVLFQFSGHTELVRIKKMCLTDTYSKVHTHKYVSDTFQVQSGLKEAVSLLPLLLNFPLQ
jgi:Reverse transcriptase (RNA-dependent DNA polymerase).